MNKNPLTGLVLVLLGTGCSGAIATPADSELPYFETLPVVLTVSRMPRPQRETPAAVTVIDHELIEASGYRDIDRLLRLVPGMMVAKERGSEQWVSYHGPNADVQQLLHVLIDGRSLSTPYFGGLAKGALPLAIEDIERIEVVRGTDAAAYGTNAYLGVVNIITRHTAEEEGSSVSARVGSGGIADASGRVVARSGPLGLRITAQQLRDTGMADLHDDRRIGQLSLRGDLQLGPLDELTVLSGLSDVKRQTGFPETAFNANPERDIDSREHFVHLRWRHSTAADEEFTLSAYAARERNRNEWLGDASVLDPRLQAIPVNDNYNAERKNVEFQHQSPVARDLRLNWGGEWRRDELEAPFLFFGAPTQAEESRRVFGNLEWRATPEWLWNVGAMAERFRYDRTRISPRLFVNWLPTPNQTWRAGYARAFRHASLFDRRGDVRIVTPGSGILLQHRFVPNAAIKPAQLDTFELGYFGQLPAVRGTIDVRVFQERYGDQIRRTPVEVPATNPFQAVIQRLLPPSQWSNRDEVIRMEGIEYQLQARPWRDGKLLFSHTLIRARSRDEAIRRSIAPYTASLTWMQRAGAWQSTLSLLRVGPLDAGTGFSPDFRYSVPAYTTLDASLAREFRLDGGNSVELRLTGLNLLGRHQELAHYPLQRLAGDKPVNRLEPQLALSLSVQF